MIFGGSASCRILKITVMFNRLLAEVGNREQKPIKPNICITSNRLLAEVRQQATGNRQQWEELEFFGIKLI